MNEAASEAFGFALLSYEGHDTVQIKPIFYRLGRDLVDFSGIDGWFGSLYGNLIEFLMEVCLGYRLLFFDPNIRYYPGERL